MLSAYLPRLGNADSFVHTEFSRRSRIPVSIINLGRLLWPLRSSYIEAVMTVIKQDDLIQSVADALQYISYYHPVDFIQSLARAYEKEQSPAARDAIAQLLINSRMCAEGHRPICQDTGIVSVFLKVGM